MMLSHKYTDMGDIMEIYLYRIKLGLALLHSSLYIFSVLYDNKIKNIKIEEFRNNIIKYTLSKVEIKPEMFGKLNV